MKVQHDCIVCGNLVADIIGRPINSLVPKHNTGHTRVDQVRLFTGGFGCNVSIALTKLGVSTGVIGRVGNDEWKELICQALSNHGVDTGGLIIDPEEQTPATIVCVDSTGERTFYHTIGAHKNLCAEDLWAHRVAIEKSRVVALGYYGFFGLLEPILPDLLRKLKTETRAKILLDTCGSVGPTLDDLGRSLPFIDFLIPSLHEAIVLTGRKMPEEIVRLLRDRGATGVLGVKLGGDGCLLDDGKNSIRVPALAVKEVVDTTGAGDSFLAGIMTAYLHGMDLEQMARFASAAGGCCVQALGASTGIRSFEETLELANRLRSKTHAG